MTTDGNMIEVIYDIETKKIFDDIKTNDPADLGISIVSAYRREVDRFGKELRGEMKSFWEHEFDSMWIWFEEADRIIGYNSFGFDNPAMNGVYNKGDFTKLKHFDILDEIRKAFGHRVKLDSVAKETIGAGKIAGGLDAVKWWNMGDSESLANLKKYCEMDVEVTTKVYDFARKNGVLKFKDRWNEYREVVVDFSYPEVVAEPVVEERQLGLF